MSAEWENHIPSDLQDDFRRQIDERVNSAIMDVLASSTEPVDEDALETDLRQKFITEYLELYRSNRWPPQVATLQETVAVAPNHWFCFRCDEKNSDTFMTCRNCAGFRDDLSERISPGEIDTWPCSDEITDPKHRTNMREQLVRELGSELDTENPLTDTRIGEEEFRAAVDKLKKQLLVT